MKKENQLIMWTEQFFVFKFLNPVFTTLNKAINNFKPAQNFIHNFVTSTGMIY